MPLVFVALSIISGKEIYFYLVGSVHLVLTWLTSLPVLCFPAELRDGNVLLAEQILVAQQPVIVTLGLSLTYTYARHANEEAFRDIHHCKPPMDDGNRHQSFVPSCLPSKGW